EPTETLDVWSSKLEDDLDAVSEIVSYGAAEESGNVVQPRIDVSKSDYPCYIMAPRFDVRCSPDDTDPTANTGIWIEARGNELADGLVGICGDVVTLSGGMRAFLQLGGRLEGKVRVEASNIKLGSNGPGMPNRLIMDNLAGISVNSLVKIALQS